MGRYINPGNSGFSEIVESNYVDKTLLVELINKTINTTNKLTCISRPRRFGKSFAAKMLAAYYDCGCDSHTLFDDKKIAKTERYEKNINKYNVVYIEVTSFISETLRNGGSLSDVPRAIVETLSRDIDASFGSHLEGNEFKEKMISAVSESGRKFVFIIDEWDAVIREGKNDEKAQKLYLELLREWFKNGNFTPRVVAAAYMTGILPIKKDGSQSALSDFKEYTMLDPLIYAEFVGFTEKEVENLCSREGVDFSLMKYWYNGYSFPEVGAVYNPNSVMSAVKDKRFKSYWVQTSASEGLFDYINRDYMGLQKTIAELIGGIDVKVNTYSFANDLTSFRDKDDVLTLLIHLGYLSYNPETETVRIPNEEIKREFQKSIRFVNNKETQRRLKASDKLFQDTISMNEKEVAEAIERVHREETSPLHYNREESLRSVIKLAYYTYRDHYLRFEELPSGLGYADIVYIPLPDSLYPVLVIELKWNKSALGAIDQILDRKYPTFLSSYNGDILLVGINYDKDDKKHTAKIVEYKI